MMRVLRQTQVLQHMGSMKRISLLRHAKSSRDDPALDDFERPLSERGRGAGPEIGAAMAENRIEPDIVLCSSARRTRQTLDLIAGRLGRPHETRILDALYMAGAPEILSHINALPGAFGHVLVIGHNPGLEALAAGLADPQRSDEPALRRLRKKFPTGALACFEFDAANWTCVAEGEGRLVCFVTPNGRERW